MVIPQGWQVLDGVVKTAIFGQVLTVPSKTPQLSKTVRNCPKLSKKQHFIKLEQNLFRLFILFKEFIQVSILNQYSTALFNFQLLTFSGVLKGNHELSWGRTVMARHSIMDAVRTIICYKLSENWPCKSCYFCYATDKTL